MSKSWTKEEICSEVLRWKEYVENRVPIDSVEDVLSTATLEALKSAHRAESLTNFCFGLVRNTVGSELRRLTKERAGFSFPRALVPSYYTSLEPLDSLLSSELWQRVAGAINRLAPPRREAIELFLSEPEKNTLSKSYFCHKTRAIGDLRRELLVS